MADVKSRTKVLVANRSEIACRVFQACRELGIPTVAIFAPGDEGARHVTFADQIMGVKSYLDPAAVVAAARVVGATLVHPGYGFLSERPVFVRALDAAGIGFIGPRAESMEAMGDKISAKKLADQMGVPTLAWRLVPSGGDLAQAAAAVGFPLLLKASAGGGGKGMRRVNAPSELAAAAESASAEALAAFGDGTLFLERLIESARHIEVQVFGDGTGAGVALHSRECSLQRRHQKVWEEATAPHLSDATRKGLEESALKMVQATRYRSAGTIEFLVDEKEDFFFLEMNTRLQVEHPVTELVTGVDLVHTQLAQALAPTTPALSAQPAVRGHAIEVRLYAEDPAQDFAPTPGRVEKVRWPTGAGIRVDSGIEEGQVIGTSFDSLLAKIIVHAHTREAALARMRFALEETVVLGSSGLATNQSYLLAIGSRPEVQAGRVTTAFLGTEFARWRPEWSEAELAALTGVAARAARGVSAGGSTSHSSSSLTHPSPWETYR